MQETLQEWKSRLIAIVSQFEHDDGAHDIHHLNRVWNLAQTMLIEHPEADAMVVLAACYLHDVVNVPKNHPDRTLASRQAARLACAQLEKVGFPVEKLEGVAHAIEAHSFSASITPTTIEAKIVQDADRLDALGAIGLARLFYTAGRMGSAFAHPSDPLALQRTLEDRAYALDHIEQKLAKLPSTMQTAIGRRIGLARLEWLRAFRETFVSEWG
jgi:uncharacterized protein